MFNIATGSLAGGRGERVVPAVKLGRSSGTDPDPNYQRTPRQWVTRERISERQSGSEEGRVAIGNYPQQRGEEIRSS
jgi:hypothetical protein